MQGAHEAGGDVAAESLITMSSSSITGAEAAMAAKDYVGGEEESESSNEAGGELSLELSLGLTNDASGPEERWGPQQRCCWLLTAKDRPRLQLPRLSQSTYSSISSSSVFSSSAASSASGTKWAATDSFSPDAGGGCHLPPPSSSNMVVGWPPVTTSRMNGLFNHSKDETKVDHHGDWGEDKVKAFGEGEGQETTGKATRRSVFVKVNMDGDPIGRKVDLSVHHSYETLGHALENMFQKPTNSLACSNQGFINASKPLYASSEFYLTYEDKDGDWMLAGDVPWGMFLDTVKKLRILRTCDASGF